MSDLAVVPSPEPATVPEAPVSIADHAAEFSPAAQQEAVEVPAPVDATDGQRQGETPAQAQQRRDKATGQWREGKTRHRAKSQQAGAEDVPRIQALTAKHRAAEERATQLEAELTRYRQGQQTQAQPEQRQERQPQPQTWQHDAEPVDTDPKYADNYGLFLADQARWAGRDEFRRARAYEHHQQQLHQRATSWRTKAEATAAKFPDFQQVALQQPVPWATGSVVDQFILEDDAGPEILYHLQSNLAERDSLGQMTVLQATKHLALLSQRLLSATPGAAVSNGAAPAAPIKLPPTPPTPLRTEAQRPTPAAPPMDGSLSILEHARHFGPKRR